MILFQLLLPIAGFSFFERKTNMSSKRIIFLIPLLLSILFTPLAATSADLSEILKKGEVTIAVPEAFPPFGSVGKSGKHEGYDVDVAKLIAKDLGVKLKLSSTNFHQNRRLKKSTKYSIQ